MSKDLLQLPNSSTNEETDKTDKNEENESP
jgi:hypothetical protein